MVEVEKNGWRELMCNIEVETTDELSTFEEDKLTEKLIGQLSDGWGEGFEQQAIENEIGKYYFSLGKTMNDGWVCDLVRVENLNEQHTSELDTENVFEQGM